MANANSVTATPEAEVITEVKGKEAVAPKAPKAKEVTEDFTHGIKRESY